MKNIINKIRNAIAILLHGYFAEYNGKGLIIHAKFSDGDEWWYDPDANEHWSDSDGNEHWYDADGNEHWYDSDGNEHWYDADGNLQ